MTRHGSGTGSKPSILRNDWKKECTYQDFPAESALNGVSSNRRNRQAYQPVWPSRLRLVQSAAEWNESWAVGGVERVVLHVGTHVRAPRHV